MEYQTCTICNQLLPQELLVRNRLTRTGFENRCRKCKQEKHRIYHQNAKLRRPEHFREKSRLSAIKTRAKRTPEERRRYNLIHNHQASRNKWAESKLVHILTRVEQMLPMGKECIIVLTENPEIRDRIPLNPERPWIGKKLSINWMEESKLPRPHGIPMFKIQKSMIVGMEIRRMMTAPEAWSFVAERAQFLIDNRERNGWDEFKSRM